MNCLFSRYINLPRLITHLKIEKRLRDPLVSKISKIAYANFLLISKIFNLIFGDHHWHSRSKGEELLARYRNENPEQRSDAEISDLIDLLGTDDPDFPKIKSLNADDRTHFHLQANEFGKNSQLEGSYSSAFLSALRNFMSTFSPAILYTRYGIDSALREELQNSVSLSSLTISPKKLRSKIQEAIRLQKNLLIEGGWVGLPSGHAIYYEVVPQPDGMVHFRVYNLGEGCDRHHGLTQEGDKFKAAPGVEWRNIRTENLLNLKTLESLIELKKYVLTLHPESSARTPCNYDAPDLYVAFCSLLNPEEKVLLYSPEGNSATVQHSGICAWRSLQAFLRVRISTPQYKKLMLDLKLSSLTELSKDKFFRLTPKVNHWRLAKKSFKKVCRRIDHAVREGLVSEKYATRAKEHLKITEEWIQSHKPVLTDQTLISPLKAGKRVLERIKTIKPPVDVPKTPPLHAAFEMPAVEMLPTSRVNLHEQMKPFHLDRENPLAALQNLTQAAEIASTAWRENQGDHGLHVAVMQYIRKLPAEMPFWVAACGENKEFLQDISAQLRTLRDIAFKTTFMVVDERGVHSEQYFAQAKLLGLFCLLNNIFNPDLNQYLPFDILWSIDHFFNSDFPFYESEFYPNFLKLPEKEGNIHGFLESVSWGYSTHRDKGYCLSLGQELRTPPRVSGNQIAYDLLRFYELNDRQTYEELSRTLRFDPAKRGVNYFHMLESESLPHSLLGYRDACLSYHWLRRNFCTPSQNIDRTEGLNFKYEIQEQETRCYFEIHLSGITKECDAKYGGLRSQRLGLERQIYGYNRQIKGNDNLKAVYTSNCLTEDRILQGTTRVNSPQEGMLLEEYRELRHLYRSTVNSHWELLGYFKKNPTKLLDLNYQIFFKHMLFNKVFQNLWNPHKRDPANRFKDQLEKMIEEQYQQAFLEGHIQPCVFFNQVASLLKTYYPDDNRVFGNLFEKFQELLARPQLKEHHKSTIYGGLLEHLNTQERLTEAQSFYALRAIRHLAQYPIPEKWSDPETVKQVKDFPFKHAQSLIDFFRLGDQPDQDRIREVLNEERFQEAVWEVNRRGSYPMLVIAETEIQYDLFTGEITDSLGNKLIPSIISQNPIFKKLFPKVVYCERIHNGIVYFVENGKENYVRIENRRIIIDQKREDRWYRYINKSSLIPSDNSIYPQFLYIHYETWALVDQLNQILFCDRITKRVVYTMNRWTRSIQECETGLTIKFPSSRLRAFEDAHYIQEWYRCSPFGFVLPGAAPVKMELPRYGLTFDLAQDESGEFECRELPGFRLKGEERLSTLGICRHYLVLENHRGIKKVIFPRRLPVSNRRKTPEVLTPYYKLEKRDPEARSFKSLSYFCYDVDDLNRLYTPSKEGMLLLALNLALAQKYTGAADTLRLMKEKLTPYSVEELEILNRLIDLKEFNKDISGNALAIRLYAVYLIMKNTQIKGAVSTNDLGKYEKVFKDYLAHRPNAVALLLTPNEENYLREQLLSKFSPELRLTLPSSISPVETSSAATSDDEKNAEADERWKAGRSLDLDLPVERIINFKNKGLFEQIWSFIPHKSYLLTRSRAEFNNRFYYYFERAAHGTEEEKNAIFVAAAYLKTQGSDLMGSYLQYVTKTPDEYPRNDTNRPISWYICQTRARELKDRGLLDPPEQPMGADRFAPAQQKQRIATQQISELEPVFFQFEPSRNRSMAMLAKDFFVSNQIALRTNQEPLTWLNQEREGYQLDNPLAARECERLQDDFTAHSQENDTVYSMNQDRMEELKQVLESGEGENLEALKRLKREILSLARQKPKNPDTAALIEIQEWGGQKKITFDQILVSFALQRPELLQKRNPHMNQDDFNRLFTMVAEWIDLSTFEQQRKRSLKAFKKVERCDPTDGETRKALVHQLGKIVMTERVEEVCHKPPLLVFEYYAQKILWPKQVESLNAFLERKNENIVRQMIMGSGKSEVLIPLLALLRADGNDLSMIVVPQPLFENVSTATQKIVKEAFDQTLHTLYFDRNTTFTVEKLQTILNDLMRIQESREALIMTSKSIQCLLLKFIEAAEQHYHHSEVGREAFRKFTLLGSILRLLGDKGNPIFDEADTLLNILHEVCFSLGRVSPPEQTEVEFISHLYRIILDHSPFKLDCETSTDAEKGPLTEESYQREWKPRLLEQVITFFKNVRAGEMELSEEEAACLRGLPDSFLRNYLTREEEKIAATQQAFDAIPCKKAKNLVALAAEQVTHLLSYTLVKISKEHYGLDPSGSTPLAIPYAFADQPKIGSQFANPYITMNYTFQHYLKNGVSIAQLKRETDKLKDQARNEIMKSGGELSLEKTEAWKVFSHLKGDLEVPLLRIKLKHLRLIRERVNSTNEAKLHFVCRVILPQMQIFDKKLTCNPMSLIGFFKQASGFTGTLWNSKSMHRKLTPLPEWGTDAKTIAILWRHSMNEVTTIEETNPEAIVQRLATIPHEILIDGGGYIKSSNNSVIAQAMSTASGFPTVFYHENGEKMITDGEGQIPLAQSRLKPHQRKTFLDQSHAVGADVVQKIDAVGLVTVGRHVLLRDLLQHVWRLRGLADSQRVRFILSSEVKSVIYSELNLDPNEPINFSHLLKFAIRNQARRQGSDAYKGFIDQLWSVPQQILLDLLLSDSFSEEEKTLAYRQLESTWIQSVSLEASDMLGRIPVDMDVFSEIEVQMEKCRRFMREAYEKCPFLDQIKRQEEVFADFEEIKMQVIESSTGSSGAASSNAPSRLFVPQKVLNREAIGDQTTDQEVNTEKELNTEMETQEQVSDSVPEYRVWYGKNYVLVDRLNKILRTSNDELPVFRLQDILRNDEKFRHIAHLFGNIQITANAAQPKFMFLSVFSLFGPWRVPFHNVIINEHGIIICAGEDTLRTEDPNEISYQLVLGSTNDLSRPLTLEEKEAIVKIKFLNGESQYSREEMDLLQNWIDRHDRSAVKEFYEKYVLSGFPGKTMLYKNSALRKFLCAPQRQVASSSSTSTPD